MNPQKVEPLLSLLEASMADERLSDSEKYQLAEALAAATLSEEQLHRLRNRAFELVREHLQQAGSHTPEVLIKWLEQVIKVLDASRAVPVMSSSQAYFSPGAACLRVIQQHLRSARQRVDICVFTLSDDSIAEEILAAHVRGVALRVISDDEKEWDVGSDIGRLRAAGIPVALDQSEGHMHHKFAIFDGEYLLNGSYNWTRKAAQLNNENLVISQERELVRQFAEYFDGLWQRFYHPKPRH